jgi:hypothetical protein
MYITVHVMTVKSSESLTVKYFAENNLVCYSINNLLQTQTDAEILKQASRFELF